MTGGAARADADAPGSPFHMDIWTSVVLFDTPHNRGYCRRMPALQSIASSHVIPAIDRRATMRAGYTHIGTTTTTSITTGVPQGFVRV